MARIKPLMNPKKRIFNQIIHSKHFLPLVLIVALGCTVYANSLKGKFVLDDEFLIENNAYIKNGLDLSKAFNKNLSPFGKDRYTLYRPLVSFSYGIDYALWQLNPTGYHITNTILHILVVVTIYGLTQLLFKERLLSLLTGVLFLVHPVNVEAVAYMADRPDLMVALFILLCFVFYVRQVDAKKPAKDIFLMLLFFIAALLAKENSLALPVLLVMYHVAFRKKIRLIAFLPTVVFPTMYCIGLALFFKSPILNLCFSPAAWRRFPAFFVAIPNYIRLLILPLNLHIDYGRALFKFAHPQALLGIVLSAAFFVYAWRYILRPKRGNALVFFSVSWFFISLLPVSNIYPLFSYMAEHFLYLPSIGFYIILAKGISQVYKINRYRKAAISFAGCLVIIYSYLTVKQNNYWKTPFDVYTKTLQYNPRSVISLVNLGNIYRHEGKTREATELLKKAITVEPHNGRALNALGTIYATDNEAAFKKRIEREPAAAVLSSDLSEAGQETGSINDAIELYKTAIEYNPFYLTPYINLGLVYEKIGEADEAIAMYKKAIELDRHYANADYNLGNIYASQGNYEEAIEAYRKTITLSPSQVDAYYNLGTVYGNLKKYDEAATCYRKVIELQPAYAKAYTNLGVIYYNSGREDEAIGLFKKAIEIDPLHAKAYDNLCKYYFQKKQYKLAAEYCDKAAKCGLADPELLKAIEPYR